jgi:hypothetical protein
MRISIRVNGKNTSVKLHYAICTLHYLGSDDLDKDPDIYIKDIVYKKVRLWETKLRKDRVKGIAPENEVKGIGVFITNCLIEEILDNEEAFKYYMEIKEEFR